MKRWKPSVHRTVHYCFEAQVDLEMQARSVLEHAKADDVICEYGTDAKFCWFSGWAGQRLRGVIGSLEGQGWKSVPSRAKGGAE